MLCFLPQRRQAPTHDQPAERPRRPQALHEVRGVEKPSRLPPSLRRASRKAGGLVQSVRKASRRSCKPDNPDLGRREAPKTRTRRLEKEYGTTREQYDALLDHQGGRCAIPQDGTVPGVEFLRRQRCPPQEAFPRPFSEEGPRADPGTALRENALLTATTILGIDPGTATMGWGSCAAKLATACVTCSTARSPRPRAGRCRGGWAASSTG